MGVESSCCQGNSLSYVTSYGGVNKKHPEMCAERFYQRCGGYAETEQLNLNGGRRLSGAFCCIDDKTKNTLYGYKLHRERRTLSPHNLPFTTLCAASN